MGGESELFLRLAARPRGPGPRWAPAARREAKHMGGGDVSGLWGHQADRPPAEGNKHKHPAIDTSMC